MDGRKRRYLQIDALENRFLLAVAGFEFNLFEDVNGQPGSAIEQVVVDESFFVEITAQEFDPHAKGLAAVALDIEWDPNALQSLDAPFDPGQIITPNLSLFQLGELNQVDGLISNLSGVSPSTVNNIGDGSAERFALLRFRAMQPGDSLLTMDQGWSRITTSLVASLHGPHLRFEAQSITVTATGSENNVTMIPVGYSEAVGLQVILRKDAGGVPGASFDSNTLEVNDQFFVELAAQDLRSLQEGIVGLSVDVNWDTAVFEPLDEFDASDPNSDLITASFPLFRGGTLDRAAGSISDLRGSSFRSSDQGAPIGITGPERFSLMPFRAMAPTDQTTFTVSVGQNGFGLVNGDASGDARVNVESPTIVVREAAEPPQIAVTAVSGSNTGTIQFSTELTSGNSDFVRPALPDDRQFVDLTNTGPVPLTIQEIQINAPDVAVDFPLLSQLDDDLVLGPNQTQRIRLTFAPTVPNPEDPSAQSFNMSNGMVIFSNAENHARLEIALAGQSTYDADITYDGHVNISDLARLDDHFGEQNGDGHYSAVNDLNGDGTIDLGDFALLNVQFGMPLSENPPTIVPGPTPPLRSSSSVTPECSENEQELVPLANSIGPELPTAATLKASAVDAAFSAAEPIRTQGVTTSTGIHVDLLSSLAVGRRRGNHSPELTTSDDAFMPTDELCFTRQPNDNHFTEKGI